MAHKFGLEDRGESEHAVVRYFQRKFSLQILMGDADDDVYEQGVVVIYASRYDEQTNQERKTYEPEDICFDGELPDADTLNEVLERIKAKMGESGVEFIPEDEGGEEDE
jgi:hypothetical protein